VKTASILDLRLMQASTMVFLSKDLITSLNLDLREQVLGFVVRL
jgi:hypothetical protein